MDFGSHLLAISDYALFRAALAALVLSSFGIYSSMNLKSSSDSVDVLATRLDRNIPFWKIFSVPYLMYFPYLFFMVTYGIMETPYFANIAASALAVQLVASFVYWMRQTYVPRPAVDGHGLFDRLTNFIYRHDKPYCTFPSLHVAYSLLCAYWSALILPSLFPLFVVLTLAIIGSTMFIKQHHVADVLAGASLAVLSVMLIG